MSTLGKWIRNYRDTEVVSMEDQELVKENERLCQKEEAERLVDLATSEFPDDI